ncbi:hypothetical protein VMCG_03673 [Cytospora schulzeri]|uniref:SnoaL-like domain-containing protein n=1 Tax=Cytospora schulzeri TaxID=448051 RepID=A0A423WW54_9PEZI|nr:hypothetical protein VMCG_03673 [Valsa malicola]
MSPIRDTLIQTANSYIAGFNTHTAEGTNEEYQAFVGPGFKLVRHQIGLAKGEDMLVDEVSRKVMLHLTSNGETDFGPYANEYMIVLKMTYDGTQIKEIVEFIDSAATRDIVASLLQHIKPE